jgi:hypothetical protein
VLALAGEQPITALEAAIADLEAAFAPVPAAASPNRDEWRDALASRLNPLAAKIAPTMSAPQGDAWRNAMIDALSDLPAMIGLTAAKRAIHRPMSFINEVEGVIREIATEIADGRKDAIARINRLIDDLLRPPATALPAPDEGEPCTADQIRAMSKLHGWSEFKAIGLKIGAFTQGEVDDALAEVRELEPAAG